MSNKAGRPVHQPTALSRECVKTLSFGDYNQSDIAKLIGIDRKTLAKHYSEELETGKASLVNALLSKDVENALSDSSDARQSRHYLLDRIGGYVKTEKREVSGQIKTNVEDLTDEELMIIAAGGRA